MTVPNRTAPSPHVVLTIDSVIQFIAERAIRTKFLHHRPDGESLGRLMQLYREGALPLPPVEVMPLESAVAAHRKSESRTTRGKVVLHVQHID